MSLTSCGGGQNGQFFDKRYTTVAKGVAIISIMACHCSGHWTGGRLLTPLGGIGVSVFLIASGFGLNESYKRSGLAGFWRKRWVRVYLPYFFAAVGYAIAFRWNLRGCLLNFSCVHSPYWFVTYILVCYVAFWLVCAVCPAHKCLVLLLPSLAALFLLPNLQAEQSFGFVTGVALSEHKDAFMRFSNRKKAYASTVAGLFVIGVAFLALKQIPGVRACSSAWVMNIVQCLIKYPLGMAVLLSLKCLPKILSNPFLHLSGLISYELYLVHFPFYGYVQEKLWPALLLTILSYLVAYIFNKMNNRLHGCIVCKE